jgi:hypothetical protein
MARQPPSRYNDWRLDRSVTQQFENVVINVVRRGVGQKNSAPAGKRGKAHGRSRKTSQCWQHVAIAASCLDALARLADALMRGR